MNRNRELVEKTIEEWITTLKRVCVSLEELKESFDQYEKEIAELRAKVWNLERKMEWLQ